MNANETTLMELEFYRELLADLEAVNEVVASVTGHIAEVPVTLLGAMLVPVNERGDMMVAASRQARDGMNSLATVYGPLNRLLALVAGRVDTLTVSDATEQHSVRVEP